MAKGNKKVVQRVRRRERKNIERGHAHIQSTFNNTIVTLTDVHGNAISWASSGQLGFKGSRKATPFASQMAAETAAKAALVHGLKSVKIFLHRELMSSVFTGRMVPAKRHLSIHLKFLKYYCPGKKSEPNYQIVFLLDRNRQNYNLSLASSS